MLVRVTSSRRKQNVNVWFRKQSTSATSYSGAFILAFYLHFIVSTLQTVENSEKLRMMLSLWTLLRANEDEENNASNDDDDNKKENDDGRSHFRHAYTFIRRHS